MNKLLIITGLIFSLIWGFISIMSTGVPLAWCQVIDKATFHLFSDEVFKMANGFYYDVNNSDMPTVMFILLYTCVFAIFIWLIRKVEERKPVKYSLGIIILFSVLLRLILLPGEPIHENDFYRYLWDGQSLRYRINPYKYAPSDLFVYEYDIKDDYYDEYHDVVIKARSFTWQEEEDMKVLTALRDARPAGYERIGHWQVPTVYPPVAQGLFGLSYLMAGDSYVGLKCFFMFFDLGVLFVVIALLKHFRKNPCMSVVYGWCPLVLKEFANSGHYDPLAIFFTMLSLLFYFKGRQVAAFGTLALAALSKFFSGVLLPLYLKSAKKRYAVVFFSVVALFYIPFFYWDQVGVNGVFEGLATYNQQWSYNSSIFVAIFIILDRFMPALTETLMPAKVVSGLIYLIFLIILYRQSKENDLQVLHQCFLAVAVLFVINPVGDPWYFCWTVPFLCFFPYRSWLLLSGMLILSYLNFHPELAIVNTWIFGIPFVNWMIYAPFFMYFVYEKFIALENKEESQLSQKREEGRLKNSDSRNKILLTN